MKEYLMLMPGRIANQIRMTRSYPGHDTDAFLLVEGSTDERVYKRFINKERCQIIIAYSKDNVINVLAILEKDGFLGVLAIVDADFMLLEGKNSLSPNLLLTDMHDIELMMLNSPALEKVLDEFGSEEKIATCQRNWGKDLRAKLLELALPLGYLRWISLRENLALKFENLKFTNFIDEKQLVINEASLVRHVQSHTIGNERGHRPALPDQDILDKIAQAKSATHDPWHICCGHDVVCILAFCLRKTIGSSQKKEDEIEACLRLAYETAYFIQTQLYTALQNWEWANAPFVVVGQQ